MRKVDQILVGPVVHVDFFLATIFRHSVMR